MVAPSSCKVLNALAHAWQAFLVVSGLFRNLILYPITHLKQSAAPRFLHLLCEVDLLFSQALRQPIDH